MTTVEDRPAAEVGQARRRKEDQRLLTGRTRWTDNIQLPGMLHLAMVRSPFAHATITNIDTSAARSAPGVVGVFTGADLQDGQGVIANAWPLNDEQKTPTHLPVAVDHVACAGEIVAVVAARTAAAARDAAELVDVDYDELPAVLDAREAMKDEVLVHPDLGTNRSAFWQLDSAAAGTGGDVDAAIAEARENGIVIEREYRQQRLVPAFMEPRSTVVDPTGEQIVIWSATQIPHILRFFVAATTGISGGQGPHHRPRRRRRLRRQAPDDARRSSPPSPSPAGSGSPASSPRPAPRRWCRATTAATSGRR